MSTTKTVLQQISPKQGPVISCLIMFDNDVTQKCQPENSDKTINFFPQLQGNQKKLKNPRANTFIFPVHSVSTTR